MADYGFKRRELVPLAAGTDGCAYSIPVQERHWYAGIVDAARRMYQTVEDAVQNPLYLFSRTKPQGGHGAKQRTDENGRPSWTKQGGHTHENAKAQGGKKKNNGGKK